MPIRCEIVSQDRMVWEGDVDIVIVPGVEGEMGILPNHAPLLSTLQFGILKVRYGNQEEDFTVAGGLVEVQPDIVTVLADSAENIKEIDIARAEAARQRAEEMLKQGVPEDSDVYAQLDLALRRSRLRLDAASRYRRAGRTRTGPGGPGSGQEHTG
jgi:F-type H+-transporting ATPase subunit epsilon